jgi:hypothetical protein
VGEPTAVPEDIVLDPEFASLLPPHTPEELSQLEQNLLADKRARDALVLWKGRSILVDGYGRLPLCRKHGLPYPLVERDFADREAVRRWIISNQRGRRNLTPEWAAYIRGETYLAEKQSQGGTGANRHTKAPAEQSGKSCHSAKTEERLGAEFKTSSRTIRNDGDFAEAIDTLAQNCGDDARQQILCRQTPLTRKEVVQLAKEEPAEQRQALNEAVARKKAKQKRAKPPKAPKPAEAEEATASTGTKEETITVPKEPRACAKSLMLQLGPEAAAQVQQALARLLGSQAAEPGAGRPKGRRRRPVGAV